MPLLSLIVSKIIYREDIMKKIIVISTLFASVFCNIAMSQRERIKFF